MTTTVATRLYKIGDLVLQSGVYMCVPCGYTQFLDAGERLITCLACFAGTADGPEEYRDAESEFWQFIG